MSNLPTFEEFCREKQLGIAEQFACLGEVYAYRLAVLKAWYERERKRIVADEEARRKGP